LLPFFIFYFAARADQQVRIRLPGRVEEARELRLVEVAGPHAGLDRALVRVQALEQRQQ